MSVVPGRDPLFALQPAEVAQLYALHSRDRDLVSGTLCRKCAVKAHKIRKCDLEPTSTSASVAPVQYGMTRIKQLLVRHEHLLDRCVR